MNNGIFVQDVYGKAGFENNLIKDCINLGGTNSPISMPLHFPSYVHNYNVDYNKLVLVYDLSQSSGTNISVNFQSAGRFTIDWGDGNFSIETITTVRSVNYTYKSYGTYVVQIFTPTGYPQIFGLSNNKLIKVLSFGNMNSSNLFLAFPNSPNLIEVPKYLPSSVTIISSLLTNDPKLNDPNISLWDTTNITTFSSLFSGCTIFNQPLNGWNTSNVTIMTNTFLNARNFNQPLNNWNVRKVTSFASMFQNAVTFDESLSGWSLGADTAGTNCSSMFESTNFNQPINDWNTSKVTNTSRMFRANTVFNRSLDTWNTSLINNMNAMFNLAFAFNQNIGTWNVGLVTDMNGMFGNALAFNNGGSSDINNWNTSNVTNMGSMFVNASSFNQSLNNWNVRKVTNFASMFQSATGFNSSLSGWALGADTAGATCESMFFSATNFTGSGLDSWDTSKVTNMRNMLRQSSFNTSIGSWDVSKVTNMEAMFYSTGPFNQSISNWNLAGLNINSALDNFMGLKTGASSYSTTNYDALLIGWNNNKLAAANGVANWRTDLRPNFGGAKYTSGGAAATARAALVSYGWTITDGGVA